MSEPMPLTADKALSNSQWLQSEPFTLVLSAGFFGFYAHTGVLAALEVCGLSPRRVIGSSAGAISGGIWAAGASTRDMWAALVELRRSDFWDPSWAPRSWGRDDPGTALGLLRGRKLDHLLLDLLGGVERLEDCPTPFAAVTHELSSRQTVVHERGPLRAAIRASAALPVMFGPVRIAGRLYADGGIGDRPGFSALAAEERTLYHHLPHRSRWPRITGSDAHDLQTLPHRRVLSIDHLPRVHPGALHRGREAMALAKQATLHWLSN